MFKNWMDDLLRHVTLQRQQKRKQSHSTDLPEPLPGQENSSSLSNKNSAGEHSEGREQWHSILPDGGVASSYNQGFAPLTSQGFQDHQHIMSLGTFDAIMDQFDVGNRIPNGLPGPSDRFQRDHSDNDDNDIPMPDTSFSCLLDLDGAQNSTFPLGSTDSSNDPSLLVSERVPIEWEKSMVADGQDLVTSSSLDVQTSSRRGKTVLTVENMDPDTRGEVLNLLCQKRLVTKIEIQ